MQAILESISALNGVRYAAIYKAGQLLASNFVADRTEAINRSGDMLGQAFSALSAVNKSHDEIFFSLQDGYLAAFKLQDGHLAILETEKKINFPMISLGLRSVSETLRQQAEERQAELERQERLLAASNLSEPEIPLNHELIPQFESYISLLTTYLGPAARVVVADAVDIWKRDYDQTEKNLPYLTALLEDSLELEGERKKFSLQAADIS